MSKRQLYVFSIKLTVAVALMWVLPWVIAAFVACVFVLGMFC